MSETDVPTVVVITYPLSIQFYAAVILARDSYIFCRSKAWFSSGEIVIGRLLARVFGSLRSIRTTP